MERYICVYLYLSFYLSTCASVSSIYLFIHVIFLSKAEISSDSLRLVWLPTECGVPWKRMCALSMHRVLENENILHSWWLFMFHGTEHYSPPSYHYKYTSSESQKRVWGRWTLSNRKRIRKKLTWRSLYRWSPLGVATTRGPPACDSRWSASLCRSVKTI